MTCILRCFAVALALPLGALTAQEAPTLATGARVRVNAPKPDCTSPEVAPCYRQVVGSLEFIDSATIIVRRENGEAVHVPREPSTRLEVSAPGRCGAGRRGTCAAIGLFGGAAFGAATGLIIGHMQGCVWGGQNVGCAAYLGVAIPGALVGMVVGAVVGGEDWKRADVPARLSVGPDRSGRLSLGLSVPF
jgi:hypothetical protein